MDKQTKYELLIDRILSTFVRSDEKLRCRLVIIKDKRNSLVHKNIEDVDKNDLDFLRYMSEQLFDFFLIHCKEKDCLNKIKYIYEHGQKSKNKLKEDRKNLNYIIKHTTR